MASGLRAGTGWYGMRPPPADDEGAEPKYADKSDAAAADRRSGARARRQRRLQSGSGTARIAGPA